MAMAHACTVLVVLMMATATLAIDAGSASAARKLLAVNGKALLESGAQKAAASLPVRHAQVQPTKKVWKLKAASPAAIADLSDKTKTFKPFNNAPAAPQPQPTRNSATAAAATTPSKPAGKRVRVAPKQSWDMEGGQHWAKKAAQPMPAHVPAHVARQQQGVHVPAHVALQQQKKLSQAQAVFLVQGQESN